MLKIENFEVLGWEHAIRGMRNPMNSWEKSDSFIPCYQKTECHKCEVNQKCTYYFEDGNPYKKDDFIGPNDYALMKNLRNAGTDHRKFMRMITVYLDIIAPLYWWKEFDTYKVGTVANSCSTMHKIHSKEFTIDDFSCEHLVDNAGIEIGVPDHDELEHIPFSSRTMLELTTDILNVFREMYLKSKDKKYWWQMIQLLPSSYNQKRTVMLNYEVLSNIYKSRRNHKLDEWHTFCDWIESLPYSELIIGKENSNESI